VEWITAQVLVQISCENEKGHRFICDKLMSQQLLFLTIKVESKTLKSKTSIRAFWRWLYLQGGDWVQYDVMP
jgi:hypothetical protein